MLREFIPEPAYSTTDEDTVFALLSRRAERDPEDLIAQWQDDETRRWHDVTAGEMLERVRSVAKGLLGLGVKTGNMVVIYSPTCYEWGVVDFACAAIGAVSVPVYETDSAKQTESIIEEVNPVIAFAGDSAHTQTLERIREEHSSLRYVFNFKADGLDAVADFGEGVSEDALDQVIVRVKADDMLTIVYTSGSTGKPKGAMLSHRNFTHIVLNGYIILDEMLYQPNRLMLFLPLAHCFARYIQYVAIGGQGVVGYLPGAKHLLADLRSFKPTYLLGVPRVFEKVYNAASQRAGGGLAGKLFVRATKTAKDWSRAQQEGRKPSVSTRVAHAFYERIVYRKIRTIFGPNADFAITGGAPMDPELSHFFNGIGMPLLEGYGMTETCGPVCVSLPENNRIGTIGQPLCGVTAGIADDGELCVKGGSVCMGYHNNPDITAQQITDGWLHTGDLGDIDEDGFVHITGRKKDLIITAGGKNVSPGPIEEVIKRCEFVSQALVLGDKRPFISALVTLDEESLRPWLESKGLDRDMPMEDAANNAAVRAEVQKWVDQANEGVSRAESVRKFIILPEEFTQENGLMTSSMKVIRPKVIQRYATLLNTQMYTKKK